MESRGLVERLGFAALVGSVSLVPALAFAQSTPVIDPTETLALVADAKDFIVTVGLAVLGMLMVAKGIKWARRAG